MRLSNSFQARGTAGKPQLPAELPGGVPAVRHRAAQPAAAQGGLISQIFLQNIFDRPWLNLTIVLLHE